MVHGMRWAARGRPAAALSFTRWFSMGRWRGVDGDGARSAPGADLGRVDRHHHRRGLRARVVPADRAGVRKFLVRFRDEDLEVALEATTGWRFVVEELERIGAEVHLAEPAETAA